MTDRALTFAIDHYLIMRPADTSPEEILSYLDEGGLVLIAQGIRVYKIYDDVPTRIIRERILKLAEQFRQYASMEGSDQVIRLKDKQARIEAAFDVYADYKLYGSDAPNDSYRNLYDAVKGE